MPCWIVLALLQCQGYVKHCIIEYLGFVNSGWRKIFSYLWTRGTWRSKFIWENEADGLVLHWWFTLVPFFDVVCYFFFENSVFFSFQGRNVPNCEVSHILPECFHSEKFCPSFISCWSHFGWYAEEKCTVLITFCTFGRAVIFKHKFMFTWIGRQNLIELWLGL